MKSVEFGFGNISSALLFGCIIVIRHCQAYTTQRQAVCTSDHSKSENQFSQKLYHARSRQCYEFATRGPCGENMILYKHPMNPKYGFCDCDQGVRSQYPCTDHPVRKMFYFPRKRKCFPIFSQGPCKEGFWLNYVEKSQQIKCQPNPCLATQSMEDASFDWRGSSKRFWFYDPLRNACFLSQSRGYCPVGFTLELTHDSHLPKCRRQVCYSKLTNFRSDLTCRPGSRYSYLWRGCLRTSRYFYGIG